MKKGLKGATQKLGTEMLKTVIIILVVLVAFIYLYVMSQPIPDVEGLGKIGIRWDIPLWHVVVFVLAIGFGLGIYITHQVMKQKKDKNEGDKPESF